MSTDLVYERVRDYVLVGPGGAPLYCLTLTESEVRDCNLELECEGAILRWEPFQQAA